MKRKIKRTIYKMICVIEKELKKEFNMLHGAILGIVFAAMFILSLFI